MPSRCARIDRVPRRLRQASTECAVDVSGPRLETVSELDDVLSRLPSRRARQTLAPRCRGRS